MLIVVLLLFVRLGMCDRCWILLDTIVSGYDPSIEMDNDPTGNCGPPPRDIVKVLFSRAEQCPPRPKWNSLTNIWGSRYRVIDKVTRRQAEHRRMKALFPAATRYFSFFTKCPDRLWVSHNFIPDGYIRHILEGEPARAWSWPLTHHLLQSSKK